MIKAIVIMGVCGTGKTTIGERVAARLDCPFLEGDDFHPSKNVEKMRAGVPLDDLDRWPWLETLGKAIGDYAGQGQQVVAACSALKRSFRDRLRISSGQDILFILLHGKPDLLEARMTARLDHYMPASLLDSQLAILERPGAGEKSVAFDVADTPDRLIEKAVSVITATSL